MEISIRRAKPNDCSILTDISLKAKRYWNYPEEYYEIWKDELTIREEYIKNNTVYVAEHGERIVGYYSIIQVEEDFWAGKVFVMKGYWLEHIFILPEYIGKGIGSRLIEHAKSVCCDMGCKSLFIFSDPHARGFYERIGAKFIRESPSSIEGRIIPVFEMDIF